MTEKPAIHCRLLDAFESAAFREAATACYVTDKGLQGENAEAQLSYRMGLFDYDNLKHFVLYDGKTPIGISAISLDTDGPDSTGEQEPHHFTLQNIHLLSSYRGQGLGHILYKTPLDYLREHFKTGTVEASVHFQNAASIKLVEDQGFKAVKRDDDYIKFEQPLMGVGRDRFGSPP